ncbi:ubx domain protein [Grosmannia clavigera kw1407]|uniref:Ubx domain protein n=1 Tax=Grosmannia clavigera (strain kw1407 / UAMH 11150) TaxID=655863 RepID=F0XM59_GROCL|nr:ubx domain protein [Grosmannia clavigera kw1407]EFX01423.1 ubx domain protein [Grosmannia clavigera kw1407]
MTQSDLEVLLEMGFEQERAELAVKKSGGLQGALTWLESTQDTSLEELRAAGAASKAAAAADKDGENSDDEGTTQAAITALETNQEAKSLVCNECGKMFRSQATAEFHAAKSGHTDFAESTEEVAPLTEEQKAARLAELRDKLKEKRNRQALADKEDTLRNEKIRLKSTKESQDLKEDLQRKEQIKEAAKKRAEKKEEIEVKKRIKARIEADKEERRRKAEEAKAARDGRAPTQPAASSAAASSSAGAGSSPSSTAAHSQARLRLQLPSGNVQKTFSADATLFEVAQALEADDSFKASRFELTYPRKVFEGPTDLSKSLRELGLVPSAVLRVQ